MGLTDWEGKGSRGPSELRSPPRGGTTLGRSCGARHSERERGIWAEGRYKSRSSNHRPPESPQPLVNRTARRRLHRPAQPRAGARGYPLPPLRGSKLGEAVIALDGTVVHPRSTGACAVPPLGMTWAVPPHSTSPSANRGPVCVTGPPASASSAARSLPSSVRPQLSPVPCRWPRPRDGRRP